MQHESSRHYPRLRYRPWPSLRTCLRVAVMKCLAPSCPDGMAEFNIFIEGVWLVCHFEYEPAERGTAYEPAIDQMLILCSAYVGDVDIIHLLKEDIQMEITHLAHMEKKE